MKIFKATGETLEVNPVSGTHFTLDELQAIVGGFIEIVPSIYDGCSLVINEEGKLLGMPYNEAATAAYLYNYMDVIVGDAILIKNGMIK